MRTAIAVVGVIVTIHTVAALSRGPSKATLSLLTRRIPPRPRGALTGSSFAESVGRLDAVARERAILREISQGNLPSFLRTLVPVEMTDVRDGGVTIFVMPDYLAIGSDDDFLRIPMNLATATAIADLFGFVLPTRKMVDAIYQQSGHHFTPTPLPAGPRMTSTDYYRTHNALIDRETRSGGVPAGMLVSGHKKDVVVTNLLARTPGRIAIYGWHRPNGVPIQPLSIVHGTCYADYSHGVRLVAELAWQDGQMRSLRRMLETAATAAALSDEGVVRAAAAAPSTLCGIGVRAD